MVPRVIECVSAVCSLRSSQVSAVSSSHSTGGTSSLCTRFLLARTAGLDRFPSLPQIDEFLTTGKLAELSPEAASIQAEAKNEDAKQKASGAAFTFVDLD